MFSTQAQQTHLSHGAWQVSGESKGGGEWEGYGDNGAQMVGIDREGVSGMQRVGDRWWCVNAKGCVE